MSVRCHQKQNHQGYDCDNLHLLIHHAQKYDRSRRDVELCEAVQQDLALCTAEARAPALLWSSVPPKNARRLGSLDMMSEVLPELDNQFHAIPVAQDLETRRRVTFLEQSASADFLTKVESYAGKEGEPVPRWRRCL